MAISVLGLGAMAVIGIQKVTSYNNTNARNLATANAIGQAWMERLRADSLAWTEANGTAGPGSLAATQWLQLPVVGRAPTENDWFTPTVSILGGNQPAGAYSADIMGADLFAGDPMTPAFCTQVRLTRFNNSAGAALASYYRLIRAEVRVFWARNNEAVACPVGATDWDQPAQAGTYGSVYLVSALSENQAPNAVPAP